MLKIFIAIVILVVLWFLWIISADEEEEEGFGSFICIFIAATGVCAIIGAAIGKLMQNWSRGALIGSIIGFVIFIIYRLFKGANYQQAKEKEIEQQRVVVRQILSQSWTCPSCGKVNSPSSNTCYSADIRFFENGQIFERHIDLGQAYDLFFNDKDSGKYVYLKNCNGWRCTSCGTINVGGFKCKSCGLNMRFDSYKELLKDPIDGMIHSTEQLSNGQTKERVFR